jgi:hypothetical protein
LGRVTRGPKTALCRPCPQDEMQDQRDDREHEQQMDQPARNVEHGEAAKPGDK